MNQRILGVALGDERDVVLARQRARQVAALLDFDEQDQTRIATAVSELARNAIRYAGGGRAEFRLLERRRPQVLEIAIIDDGPGIEHLAAILDGRYRSATGLGLGIAGARRLVDALDVRTTPGRGTTVVLHKVLRRGTALRTENDVAAIGADLAARRLDDPLAELEQQNRELLRTLEELSRRQEDLVALNRELEDTNRGVVALYAELDDRADRLQRADQIKSRFLSHMSHEFRTPVNSIQALSRMLLERLDGPLTAEQERQVSFIRSAADSLADLVGDLLDLARVEAGKTLVRPAEFDVESLFGALRGMLRPLLPCDAVSLVFVPPDPDVPRLNTDEAKLSQILRNFVSNALKFTERGQVRVAARAIGDSEVEFSVTDTGIGIAREHHEMIFEEFSQVEGPFQRRVKGTGLGLPLCRKLAELLGGTVSVESLPCRGSTFRLAIPAVWRDPPPSAPSAEARDPMGDGADRDRSKRIPATDRGTRDAPADPRERHTVLIVDDQEVARYLLRQTLSRTRHVVLEAASGHEGLRVAAEQHPDLICLDLTMPDLDGSEVLRRLKDAPATRNIPVLVITGSMLDGPAQAQLMQRAAGVLSKDDLGLLPVTVDRTLAHASGIGPT